MCTVVNSLRLRLGIYLCCVVMWCALSPPNYFAPYLWLPCLNEEHIYAMHDTSLQLFIFHTRWMIPTDRMTLLPPECHILESMSYLGQWRVMFKSLAGHICCMVMVMVWVVGWCLKEECVAAGRQSSRCPVIAYMVCPSAVQLRTGDAPSSGLRFCYVWCGV